jgi:hypothetical protein
MKVLAMEPNRLVLGECIDAEHPPGICADPKYWIGTQVLFEIEEESENQTRLRIRHIGLATWKCSNVCNDIWCCCINTRPKQLVEMGTRQPTTEW